MGNLTEKKLILQQVIDPSGDGGVSAEYRALQQSSLKDKYHFESMVLKECHPGVNLKDICFYYKNIKDKKPDIVHIRGAAPDGLNAVIAAVLARNTKILVTVHGMYSDLVYINRIKKWISKYIIEPLIFSCADGISCVYQAAEQRPVFRRYEAKMLPHVYNRIPDYSSFPKERIRGKMRRELNIDDAAVIGVYIGRVTKEKGLSVLCDVFEQLDQSWPENFEFIIVGDGDYYIEFRSRCRSFKNGTRIHFVGRQTDVYRYLFASDFFVLPSFHENHSISLLEAFAAGIPVIATKVGGNTEIVADKVTGFVVEPKSVNQLAKTMKQMIADDLLRESFANQLEREVFPQFQKENVDMQLDSVYSKLLDK